MKLRDFLVGDKVTIDVKQISHSVHSAVDPSCGAWSFLGKVEKAVQEHGDVGTVTHVFPPGYNLTVVIGDQYFSMRGHLWAKKIDEVTTTKEN